MSDEGKERRGPPNVDGMYTLKVDNISFRTNEDILRDEFQKFGEIGDIYIPRQYGSRDSRGFAFVRFVDQRDGEDAMRSMEGKLIDGREIRIQEAKEKRPDNPREAMQKKLGHRNFRDYGRERDNYRDRRDDRDYRGGGGGRDRYDDRDRYDRDYRRDDRDFRRDDRQYGRDDRGNYGREDRQYGGREERDYRRDDREGGYGRDDRDDRRRSDNDRDERRRSRSRSSGR